MEKYNVLTKVSNLLSEGNKEAAGEVIDEFYPFESVIGKLGGTKRKESSKEDRKRKSLTQLKLLEIYHRDKFTDLYTGERLICPAALHAIAHELPKYFPYPGGATKSHQGMWELFPTLDHVHAHSKGGLEKDNNYLTTSMSTNMKKGNMNLEELGWSIVALPEDEGWDGLLSWYCEYIRGREDEFRNLKSNKGWHDATLKFNSTL